MKKFKELFYEEPEQGIKGQKVTGEGRNLTSDEAGKDVGKPEMKRDSENKVSFTNDVIKKGLGKVTENALKLSSANADVTKVRDILNAIVDDSLSVLSKIKNGENLVTKNAKKV